MNSTLQFKQSDVQSWAEFSGDWNPIHFDKDAAARAGIPAPFAHGMLALLTFKQTLLSVASERTDSAWLKFDFRMRSPVFCDRSVAFDTSFNNETIYCNMIDSASKDVLIYGMSTVADQPAFRPLAEPYTSYVPAEVLNRVGELDHLSFAPPCWDPIVTSEALAFATTLHQRGHLQSFAEIRDFMAQNGASDSDYAMLHTRHVVHLHTGRHRASSEANPPEIINLVSFYATKPSETQDGFSTSIVYNLTSEERPILQAEAFVKFKKSRH